MFYLSPVERRGTRISCLMKSNDKVKGFNIGSAKPGKAILKKIETEKKKKEDEKYAEQVFKEFVATFDEPSKSRTWVKGGVVNPSSDGSTTDSFSAGRIYKPVSKVEEKPRRNEPIQKQEVKKSSSEKPPVLGKRKGQEPKKSKLEQFKEELKLIQQQREQRHALRQARNQSSASHSELDLSDIGPRGRDHRSSSGSSQSGASGANSQGSVQSSFYARRGQRDRRDDYPYDFDGDRTTTNLFLGNLNPKMTEQQLCEAFGRYGPLASVKIMWPRTEEERSRGRNCGFVAFMNRKDGERALENIRGKELMGFEMKLGWGKSVPIPLYPVYIPPALLELIKPPPPSGLPFNAQPREWLKSVRLAIKERARLVTDGDADVTTPPPVPDRKPFDINKMTKEELIEVLNDAIVKVVTPTDRSTLALIHRMIEFVVLEGPQFEAAIMHREPNNPLFKFLFDYQSSEHAYYRWKLWSVLHGESVNKWRTEEFRMYEGGPLWRPPPMNLFSGGMPEELVEEDDYPYAPGYVPPPQARRRDADDFIEEPSTEQSAMSRRCGLTEAQRGRFTQMLEDLEPSRTKIGEVMVWCLEHADSALDIALCIVDSVVPISELPIPPESEASSENANSESDSKPTNDASEVEKSAQSFTVTKLVARLFLASDILYNSSAKVPNASFFRKCFETHLPDFFKHLHNHYKRIDGKLKAEQLKQKVMVCFRAWEEWAIYPNEFLIRLQNIFLGLVSEVIDEEEDLAGIPLNFEEDRSSNSTAKFTSFDPDVEVLESQPLVQYDGDPLDVDGSPLDNDNEDSPCHLRHKSSQLISNTMSSGTTYTTSPSNESLPNRLFVPSKWESVDPKTVESEAVTTTSRWELLVDQEPNPTSRSNGSRVSLNGNRLSNDINGIPLDTSRWSTTVVEDKVDDDDEELDGLPLTGFGGLVAYDDEDAASPAVSAPNSPVKSSSTVQQTETSTADRTPPVTNLNAALSMSEERRALLREIEVKVVKYQDELEASRKGDKTITDEAINKQIQRYRERLLERLNEDERENYVPKKEHKSSHRNKTKSSKLLKDKPGATPSSQYSSSKHHPRNRDLSSSPNPRRDQRDRSPPRSFRDRDRPRRRLASPSSSMGAEDSDMYDSPSVSARLKSVQEELSDHTPNEGDSHHSSDRRRSRPDWDPDSGDDYAESDLRDYRTGDDVEEGEASDDDECAASFAANSVKGRHKRKHINKDADWSLSPKSVRKRQRSRSPDSVSVPRHSYRSRTPSPNRKRNHAPDSGGSSRSRRK